MKKYIAILSAAVLFFASCEDQFAVQDTSRLDGTTAAGLIEDDPEFLSSYVSGLYSYMVAYGGSHDSFGHASIGYVLDMMGLDVAINGTWNWGTYDINHDYGAKDWRRTSYFWSSYFTLINKSNEIIDFFGEDDPTNELLRSYLGQAYAMRAFAYTNLIQIYQDLYEGTMPNTTLRTDAPAVPLIFASRDGRSTEEADALSGRNTVEVVMAHIEENLEQALTLLKGLKRASKNEISYEVAQGIAARYYLATQQWDKAAAAASAAHNGYDIMNQTRLMSGFMEVEDNEVLWGFNHSTETMTSYASFFSHLSNESAGYGGVGQSVHCIDRSLYDQIPETDFRKALFNGAAGDPTAPQTGGKMPYAARKFGFMAQWLQDYLYMRNAEMYLIEAEAYVRMGNGSQAASTLATLMAKRDPSWNQTTVTLEDVLLQRRIELWGEGFEFFDLRRNGLGVDRKYEGTNHTAAAQFAFPAHTPSWNFQIPLSEEQNNPQISPEDQNEWVSGAE